MEPSAVFTDPPIGEHTPRIGLLGPVVVWHTDDPPPATVGSGRVRALLAALTLAHPAPVSTGRLVDDVWPAQQPRNPLSALHTQISRLRAILGAEAVTAVAGGYRLTLDAPASDLAAAEALVARIDERESVTAAEVSRALVWWRGDPGTGLDDELREAVATRAGHAYQSLRHHHWVSRLDTEPGAVVREIEAARRDRPLDEPLAALGMRAHLAAGDPNGALRIHARIAAELAETLGADPGPELAAAHVDALAFTPFPRTPPPPPTHFVARAEDLERLRTALTDTTLVTVVGPGGIGKSRLIAEFIAGADAPDLFLDLSAVRRDDDLTALVAATLGRGSLPERDSRAPADGPARAGAAIAAGAPAHAVVVLDGAEHAPHAVRALAEALLGHRDDLRVVIASRVALDRPGEHSIHLGPLDDDPARALFTDRAHAVRPGAQLDSNLVDELCRRLDGSPLALELAAAQLRHLSLRDIVERLDERFDLLGGARSGGRGLAEVMQASWDLLDAEARHGLVGLSRFPGDVRAGDVLALDGVTLDSLAVLCDHSLVGVVDGPDGRTRYHLTDTVREFVRDKASDDRLSRSFIAWATATVGEIVGDLRAGRIVEAAQRLDETSDAVLAAITEAVELGADVAPLLPAVTWRWVRTGGHPGTDDIAGAAVATAGDTDGDVVGIVCATLHLALMGHLRQAARARSLLRRIAEPTDDALMRLATDLLTGPPRKAPSILARAARADDQTLVAVAELLRADAAERTAQPSRSRTSSLHALVAARRTRNPWLAATAEHRLGRLAAQVGDHETAAVRFATSADLFAGIGFAEDACRVRVHQALALATRDPARARALTDRCLAESADSGRPFVATAHAVRAQLLVSSALTSSVASGTVSVASGTVSAASGTVSAAAITAADTAAEVAGPPIGAHAVYIHAVRIAVLVAAGATARARIEAQTLRAALAGRSRDADLTDLPILGAVAAAIALANGEPTDSELMTAARGARHRRDFAVLAIGDGPAGRRSAVLSLLA